MKEIWKDVVGYEGLYQVSSLGNIKSYDKIVIRKKKGNFYRKGRELKLCKNNSGYLSVGVLGLVHRIVAETFMPNLNNKKEINHKNGIKIDNRLDNLERVTRSENSKHSYSKLGRKPILNMLGRRGKLSPFSIPIIQKDLNGNIIKVRDSGKDVERKLGISHQSIYPCCKGRCKTGKGFIREYLNK